MATGPTLAAGIDTGGACTRVVVLLLEDACVRLIGASRVASRGWKRGRITDTAAVSSSILAAVGEAERLAQVSIDSAVFGVGGGNIDSSNARGGYEIGYPREIDQNDINRVVDRALHVQLREDEMVLHLFPQDFRVDGRPNHRNPRGMIGSRLEVYVHLVTASEQEHFALVGAANMAHLAVEETVFEPIAAAYAAVEHDRDEGVAVIDIGAQSTGMAVYCGDSLLYSTSLPISADSFTRDVMYMLKLAFEDAELIKEQHGCAVLGLTADHSLIELPDAGDGSSREATRRELNRILSARAFELFNRVREKLQPIGMTNRLFGVVLTGGGARLQGMCDMAEDVLDCQAHLGLPSGIVDWADDLNTPDWTTAAGLAMYSARLKLRGQLDRSRKTGWFAGLFK